MLLRDKRFLNYIIIIILSFITFAWTFWIFHKEFLLNVVVVVIAFRLLASTFIFRDYSMAWSRATQKTFLIKSVVYIIAFIFYVVVLYGKYGLNVYFYISELLTYIFLISLLMYSYYYIINKKINNKTKEVVIYGAGKAGSQIYKEFENSIYKTLYFVDDNPKLQKRSIDNIKIISKEILIKKCNDKKIDLLVIAMPSAKRAIIKDIYDDLKNCFEKVKILPSLNEMLLEQPYSKQLQNISVEDLLARRPKDLDKDKIKSFVSNKTILITGAGGSIGSELVRQCIKYNAKKIIALDHSEYNLYKIEQECGSSIDFIPVLETVIEKTFLERTFSKYKPDIVLHAAAYKHVPLCEDNIQEAIKNNIIGTKNVIDCSIENGVKKFVLISTDKAVRPTNVMGATKRVCELYAQNVKSNKTEIVAVRFGNVLGSSGSVIPKFKEQIEQGGPITVTHPEITRYFMLIPEACQLVLQAGAIGKGGEIFILDMGEPIKIVDLAKKMIELSGKDDIKIEFTGLRPGEKMYEELLINDSEANTEYESITIAAPTMYNIEKLNKDIEELVETYKPLLILKKIVPEFNHKL